MGFLLRASTLQFIQNMATVDILILDPKADNKSLEYLGVLIHVSNEPPYFNFSIILSARQASIFHTTKEIEVAIN